MSTARRTPLISALLCAGLLVQNGALAADEIGPAQKVVIDASLSEDGETLDGVISIRIVNDTGAAIDTIPLWLYPNRFEEVSDALDDRLVRWIYPAGESRGGLEISGPKWNGVDLPAGSVLKEGLPGSGIQSNRVIAEVRLGTTLAAGAAGVLDLRFRLTVPKRRGRFGRSRGVVSLGGGWFPRPMADLTGRDTSLPSDVMEADVRVALPKGMGAVLHDVVFPWEANARTIEAKGLKTEELVLVAMDRMEVDEKSFAWGKVVHVHRALNKKALGWKETRGDQGALPSGLKDEGTFSVSGRVFEVVGNTEAMIREVAPGCELADRVVLVSIPAWDHLVQLGPGPVLVSDRIWQLVPVDAALWFHDLALARAAAAALTWPSLDAKEAPSDRYVVADLIGSHFAERYTREIHKGSRTVKDLVGFASFVPTVDNLLYAPQVPFLDVYYQSIEEPDPLRDEPWRSTNRLPRGKRILGKLKDLLGPAATDEIVRELLGSDRPFRTVVRRPLGRGANRFFEQWYGDYPRMNYRLGSVEDEKAEGGRVLHRVEVIRDGDSVIEPVKVELEDESGARHVATWKGRGGSGFVEWTSNAPLDNVVIDPKGRLVEAPELSDEHPLADNFHRLPLRPPILVRAGVSGDLRAGDPYVNMGLLFRRKYDLTNAVAANGAFTPRSWGGEVLYYRSFGPKRTLNARRWFYGPALGVSRYREVEDAGPEIPEETRFAATVGSVSFSLFRDDRVYVYDPLHGYSLWITGVYTLGADASGNAVQVGRLHANYTGVFSPAIRHTFALSAGAMLLAGQPAAAQLQALSVREILKGFDVAETYGRIGFYAVVEYRHTILDAGYVKAPLFSWLDRFQGVLFVGGGTISRADGYDGLFRGDRVFTEVGYGLRAHVLALGVQQQVFAFDFAFPITPLERERQVEQADGTIAKKSREPFKLVFGVMQTF
ncbi:MAG: hypothetical protein M0R80_25340 [Proteobacteria bacterium]|nr:hypothetical protein [Pseudomonadota bacterium]